mmetsp:Transcript_19169/g.44066  ORF Transcript_19169/g.44066 Transcript_19169/m.44066 type:complete len:305 (+) Transcript_19169:591-1505(+)
MQTGRHGRVPLRQSGSRRRRVRLRRHGRLGGRPSGVRDGALRRLQPAQVSRQGPSDGEDRRLDAPVGHFPHRVPWRSHRRGGTRLDGVRGGRGPGRTRVRGLVQPAGRSMRHCRRYDPRKARTGQVVRLRDDRRSRRRHPRGQDPRHHRLPHRRRGGRLRRLRGARRCRRRRPVARAAGAGAQRLHGHRARGWPDRHPRAVCDRGPRGCRRRCQVWQLVHAHGLGLVQVRKHAHGAMPCDEVPPATDASHPLRQGADRQGRQRNGDLSRRCCEGLQGFRQGRRRQVCARPARHDWPRADDLERG